MSRSNNTDLINPAERFFEWNGKAGQIEWYDKEEKKSVVVQFPFPFLILDRVSQVTGGVDRDDTFDGYWSNAVRNLQTDIFTVRSKSGIVATGLYRDIKNVKGVKFMTGLYIAYYNDDKELTIGYLKVKGAILGAWIEFSKNKKIYEDGFVITGKTARKKGANDYFEPIFNVLSTVKPETDEAAKVLDRELQEYLKAYFAQNGIVAQAQVEADDEFDNEPPRFDEEPPEDFDDTTPF